MKKSYALVNYAKALVFGMFLLGTFNASAQCSTELIQAISCYDEGNGASGPSNATVGVRLDNTNLGYINHGDWVMYSNVDLSCVTGVDFGYGTKNDKGGYIEIRVGSPFGSGVDDATVVGTTDALPRNGNWGNTAVASTGIDTSVMSAGNLYLVFLSEDEAATSMFNLHTIQFNDTYSENGPILGDAFTVDNVDYTVTSIDPLEAEVSGSTLAAVTIPATITDAEKEVTYNVTAIGNGAFLENTNVTSVVLPSSVVTLYSDAFSGCINLETINLENIVTFSGQNTFFNTPKLTTANLSSATTLEGNFAFHGLGDSSLTSVDISSAVILGRALFSTAQFSTINIPASVTSISTKTFWNCTALTDVQVNWETVETIPAIDVTFVTVPETTDPETGEVIPQVDVNATFLGVDTANVNLLVPEGTKALYEGVDGWKDFNIVEGGELSFDNVNGVDFSVSPNPTSGLVTINSSEDVLNVTVLNVIGSVVLNDNSTQLDLSGLASGVYLVKVKTVNGTSVKRVIKQ